MIQNKTSSNMKHNERLVGSNGNQLMEQVYTILDSRIQYIEYEAQKQCKFQGDSTPNFDCIDNHAESLLNNFDRMLAYLQELNQSLKLLQILKSWLKDDNVQLIFNLLNNKRYLNYSEESLENYLKGEVIF